MLMGLKQARIVQSFVNTVTEHCSAILQPALPSTLTLASKTTFQVPPKWLFFKHCSSSLLSTSILCLATPLPSSLQPKLEVSIMANVPAIQMEEVAPVATSDATLLAPEELKAKSHRPDLGVSEKTATDRKKDG